MPVAGPTQSFDLRAIPGSTTTPFVRLGRDCLTSSEWPQPEGLLLGVRRSGAIRGPSERSLRGGPLPAYLAPQDAADPAVDPVCLGVRCLAALVACRRKIAPQPELLAAGPAPISLLLGVGRRARGFFDQAGATQTVPEVSPPNSSNRRRRLAPAGLGPAYPRPSACSALSPASTMSPSVNRVVSSAIRHFSVRRVKPASSRDTERRCRRRYEG